MYAPSIWNVTIGGINNKIARLQLILLIFVISNFQWRLIKLIKHIFVEIFPYPRWIIYLYFDSFCDIYSLLLTYTTCKYSFQDSCDYFVHCQVLKMNHDDVHCSLYLASLKCNTPIFVIVSSGKSPQSWSASTLNFLMHEIPKNDISLSKEIKLLMFTPFELFQISIFLNSGVHLSMRHIYSILV